MIFRYFICSFLLWNFIIAQEDTALSFDGVDDCVQIIDDPSLVLGDFFTIRVRLGVDLSVNTEDDDYEIISKWGTGGTQNSWRFYIRDMYSLLPKIIFEGGSKNMVNLVIFVIFTIL